MGKLQPSDFLGIDVGRLGKPTRVEVPPELQTVWQPQGDSLEEINKRRAAIRELRKEFNQKGAAVSINATLSVANTTLVTVGQNKSIFLFAATLSGIQISSTGTAFGIASIEVFNGSGTSFRTLATIMLPIYLTAGGAVIPKDNISLQFNPPIQVNQNESVRIAVDAGLLGAAVASIQYWEEDIII